EAFARYSFFVELFKENDDAEGVLLLDQVKENCARYIELVVNSKTVAQSLKEGKIKKSDIIETDNARRHSHDSLISSVKSFNKNVAKKYGWTLKGGKIPPGGIFSMDPLYMNQREAFTEWAFLLASKIYKRQFDKAKNSNYGV
ncbi:MAG: DUF3232 domain-containing protein, partial [Candidatus Woesearchaeota archaeon]